MAAMAAERALALRSLAAGLGHAVRQASKRLGGLDKVRFLSPVQDALSDLGGTLAAYTQRDAEERGFSTAPSHVAGEVDLLAKLASRSTGFPPKVLVPMDIDPFVLNDPWAVPAAALSELPVKRTFAGRAPLACAASLSGPKPLDTLFTAARFAAPLVKLVMQEVALQPHEDASGKVVLTGRNIQVIHDIIHGTTAATAVAASQTEAKLEDTATQTEDGATAIAATQSEFEHGEVASQTETSLANTLLLSAPVDVLACLHGLAIGVVLNDLRSSAVRIDAMAIFGDPHEYHEFVIMRSSEGGAAAAPVSGLQEDSLYGPDPELYLGLLTAVSQFAGAFTEAAVLLDDGLPLEMVAFGIQLGSGSDFFSGAASAEWLGVEDVLGDLMPHCLMKAPFDDEG
jgi:hypothetical protein